MGIKLVKSILITLILLAMPAVGEEIVEAAIDRKAVGVLMPITSHRFARMDKACTAILQATTGPNELKHPQQRAPLELVECLQKDLKRAAPFVTHGEIRMIPTPIQLEVDLGGDVSIGITP